MRLPDIVEKTPERGQDADKQWKGEGREREPRGNKKLRNGLDLPGDYRTCKKRGVKVNGGSGRKSNRRED